MTGMIFIVLLFVLVLGFVWIKAREDVIHEEKLRRFEEIQRECEEAYRKARKAEKMRKELASDIDLDDKRDVVDFLRRTGGLRSEDNRD